MADNIPDPEDALVAQAVVPGQEESCAYIGNTTPWYWNDPVVAPWRTAHAMRFGCQLGSVVGLHRALDEFPTSTELRLQLSDAHAEIDDPEGAEFWSWWGSRKGGDIYVGEYASRVLIPPFFCGRPDHHRDYWCFDNQMFAPNESPFVIPYPFIWLFVKGAVRYPAPGYSCNGKPEDKKGSPWDTTVPCAGDRIERLGFDGRVLAETTLVACWRLLTGNEKQKIVAGDFEFFDPERDKADPKLASWSDWRLWVEGRQ